MRTRTPRGVTLVELLIAVAVSAVVLAGVLAAVQAQQSAYTGGQRVREAQGSGRNALLYLEQKLPLAGFGIDPALAFDFGWYTGGPCPAALAPCARDATANSDELVFHARNANYWVNPLIAGNPAPLPADWYRGRVWNVVLLNPARDELTLSARTGDLFLRGQIFQIVCNNASAVTYVTIDRTVGQAGNPVPLTADAAVVLPLLPTVQTNPFRRQDQASAAAWSCLASGGRAFQIDRYRFHVWPQGFGARRSDPYLVLDTGTDTNLDGRLDANDALVVGDGIEALQVAYRFQDPARGEAGATAGTPIALVAGTAATATTAADTITTTQFPGPDPAAIPLKEHYARASFYGYSLSQPLVAERRTNHQGNIRSVRVALLGRSTAQSPTPRRPDLPGAANPALNLNVTPAWIQAVATANGGDDGYDRVRLETTINLPNLSGRRLLDQ